MIITPKQSYFNIQSVSYTHLDVYKRQNQDNLTAAVLEFREITHEPHADEPEASEN